MSHNKNAFRIIKFYNKKTVRMRFREARPNGLTGTRRGIA